MEFTECIACANEGGCSAGGLCSFPPWKVTNLSGLENLFLFAFLNTLLHLRTLRSLGQLEILRKD